MKPEKTPTPIAMKEVLLKGEIEFIHDRLDKQLIILASTMEMLRQIIKALEIINEKR